MYIPVTLLHPAGSFFEYVLDNIWIVREGIASAPVLSSAFVDYHNGAAKMTPRDNVAHGK